MSKGLKIFIFVVIVLAVIAFFGLAFLTGIQGGHP